MTRNKNDSGVELSRRSVLASMGAVGVASAVGGVGTTAFFSDREQFANNELVAGSLDVKVDWQEHYADWSTDENDDRTDDAGGAESTENLDEDPAHDFDVRSVDGGPVPDGYTGLPVWSEPQVAVPEEFVDDFQANTAVEAFPDGNNDAMRDDVRDPCGPGSNLGDAPAALDSDLRTEGTFAGQTTRPGDPLISVQDVKPGDFGELTLSFHLCGNDGFVWLDGALRGNAENGLTEPEADDPDENGGEPGELAEALRAAVWYDGHLDGDDENDAVGDRAGDNVFEMDERLVLQGRLADVLDVLSRGHGFPLDGDTSAVTTLQVGGGGSFACRTEPDNPDCADLGLLRARKIDGGDLVEGTHTYTTAVGEVTLDVTFSDEDEPVSFELVDSEFPISALIVKGGPDATVCESEDGATSSGETFTAPTNPNTGRPFAISHVDVCYELDDGDGDGDGDGPFPPDGDRDCFEASTTNFLGFAWWLPLDHGNEVQTDSVTFDLGLYTEQCRHNDGSGMVRTRVGDGFGKLQFPDREATWFARGRFGDDDAGTDEPYEVAVGTDPAVAGARGSAGHDWVEGRTEPFSLSYDGSTATFSVGENGDAATFDVGPVGSSGRFAVTAKAGAGGEIVVDDLVLDGTPIEDFDGVTAADDQVRHLLATGADLQGGFELAGTVTMVSFGATALERPAFTVSVD